VCNSLIYDQVHLLLQQACSTWYMTGWPGGLGQANSGGAARPCGLAAIYHECAASDMFNVGGLTGQTG